jgi:hypothetical protein
MRIIEKPGSLTLLSAYQVDQVALTARTTSIARIVADGAPQAIRYKAKTRLPFASAAAVRNCIIAFLRKMPGDKHDSQPVRTG